MRYQVILGRLKFPSLWLLPVVVLLLIVWQVPIVSLVQRQAGLRAFLQATWPAGLLAVEPSLEELDPTEVEVLQIATWQLDQAGRRLDTDRALGQVAVAASRFAEAKQHLLSRLDHAPDDVLARFFLGQTYLRQGKLSAGIEQWAAVRATAPLITLAQELSQQGKLTEALTALETVIELEPTNESAHLLAAELWQKQGHVERALALYQEVIALAPHKPTGYVLLGRLLFHEKRYEEAIPFFQQALQRNLTNPYGMFILLGQSYAALNRWTEAVSMYDQAIEVTPEQRGVYIWRGDAQCHLDNPVEAGLSYEQAIKLGEPSDRVRRAVEYIAQQGDCPH